jgi:DNA repair protein RecO (recombination protein O)
LIVEVFTQHHGLVTVVGKGAKRPNSNFRPILLPLQLIRISYSGEAVVKTLKSATWGGGSVMPKGDSLLLGFYINELMLRLLARDDPQPTLFDIYAQTVDILATQDDSIKAAALRGFELLLLRELGWMPDLSRQSLTLMALDEQQIYSWIPEVGLREVDGADISGLSGAIWLLIRQALERDNPIASTVRVCAELAAHQRQSLQTQLRAVLHYHCGVTKLRTRQFMLDVQSFQ